jgi:hypothetical protein
MRLAILIVLSVSHLEGQAIPAHVRQLAFLLLKGVVKKHWRRFTPEETHHVKTLLPSCLPSTDTKIRTACAMTISAVAQQDWPEQWPSLLPGLMEMIRSPLQQAAPLPPDVFAAVSGAIRALALMVDHIDTKHIHSICPVVFTEMRVIFHDASNVYPCAVRQTAVAVFATLVEVLGVLAKAGEQDARDFLSTRVPEWLESFTGFLQGMCVCVLAALRTTAAASVSCILCLIFDLFRVKHRCHTAHSWRHRCQVAKQCSWPKFGQRPAVRRNHK